MRRTNLLVRLLLIIAVIISLVLSVLIWTNNQRYERKTDTETSAKREETTTEQTNFEQVYLPTQVVNVTASKQHHLIYDHQVSLAAELRDVMKKWRFRIVRASYTNYSDLIDSPSTLQLGYRDFISLKLFGKVESQTTLQKLNRDHKFTRIIFSTDTQMGTVYFVNDKTKQVWQSSVSNVKISQVTKLIKAADFSTTVDQQHLHGQLRTYYEQPVSLTPYSYLINRRNENTYISALLSDSTNSAVDTRESGSKTIYYGGSYRNRQLTVDHRRDQLKFVDNTVTSLPDSLQGLLEKGFTAINDVGNPLADIRYFSADEKTHRVSYRSYVEGYPIFQQSDYGAFEANFNNTGSTINFSSRTLQVPVPSKSTKVVLPATKVMIQQLVTAGYTEKQIQDFAVGYRWVPDTDETDIVDLRPTYYVKIDNRWRDYQDWLADKTK
ncbi:YycH family regulatory protein [Lapidilactobacillus bayanensis]|uniref:YycH family regulatory protein n=1 Tax=Lapidilactobacillus bayanensis TaxID=2485998 RepID=UPI0013DDD597|nr:two-component system activity regulator YycH [Lapidilactobacillus bayanensis]